MLAGSSAYLGDDLSCIACTSSSMWYMEQQYRFEATIHIYLHHTVQLTIFVTLAMNGIVYKCRS